MWELYLNELRKGCCRMEVRFISILFLLICILAFLVNCVEFYGTSFSFIRKASQMTIMISCYSSYFLSLITMLLPLLAGFLYSDNFIFEKNNGSLALLLTRTSLKRIMVSKVFAVMTLPFVISFFSLSVNILLTYFTFPSVAGDSDLGFPAYDIGLNQYSSLYAFDLLRLNSEWGYTYLYVLLISLFASVLALFIFSVVNWVGKNSYLTIIGVFMSLIISGLILALAGADCWSWHIAFKSYAIGSALTPFLWLIGLGAIAIGLLIIYNRRVELIES